MVGHLSSARLPGDLGSSPPSSSRGEAHRDEAHEGAANLVGEEGGLVGTLLDWGGVRSSLRAEKLQDGVLASRLLGFSPLPQEVFEVDGDDADGKRRVRVPDLDLHRLGGQEPGEAEPRVDQVLPFPPQVHLEREHDPRALIRLHLARALQHEELRLVFLARGLLAVALDAGRQRLEWIRVVEVRAEGQAPVLTRQPHREDVQDDSLHAHVVHSLLAQVDGGGRNGGLQQRDLLEVVGHQVPDAGSQQQRLESTGERGEALPHLLVCQSHLLVLLRRFLRLVHGDVPVRSLASPHPPRHLSLPSVRVNLACVRAHNLPACSPVASSFTADLTPGGGARRAVDIHILPLAAVLLDGVRRGKHAFSVPSVSLRDVDVKVPIDLLASQRGLSSSRQDLHPHHSVQRLRASKVELELLYEVLPAPFAAQSPLVARPISPQHVAAAAVQPVDPIASLSPGGADREVLEPGGGVRKEDLERSQLLVLLLVSSSSGARRGRRWQLSFSRLPAPPSLCFSRGCCSPSVSLLPSLGSIPMTLLADLLGPVLLLTVRLRSPPSFLMARMLNRPLGRFSWRS
mmetsp:Transcript_14611/g.49881  ORF Transcript_14611/g.49881 Transcript_14611/m.49881 type:complete len:571 (+) Transcript_14611:2215-3927(+)